MHAINISAKFSLRLAHSIVGCNYFWGQRHTRILASPARSRHHGSWAIVGQIDQEVLHRQKRGQFEAESVLGDGQSRNRGIALADIVRSGIVRNFDVRNRSRTHL